MQGQRRHRPVCRATSLSRLEDGHVHFGIIAAFETCAVKRQDHDFGGDQNRASALNQVAAKDPSLAIAQSGMQMHEYFAVFRLADAPLSGEDLHRNLHVKRFAVAPANSVFLGHHDKIRGAPQAGNATDHAGRTEPSLTAGRCDSGDEIRSRRKADEHRLSYFRFRVKDRHRFYCPGNAASLRIAGRGILGSTAAGLAGYFAAAWLLSLVPLSRGLAVLAAIGSMALFVHLFRGIRDVNVTRSVRLTPVVLLLRAAFAAGIIVAITAAAQAVGPAWAGLFSAFPTALLPLVLIVHMTYGKAHVHTIIKNFPHGIGSLVAYGVSVSYLYPAWGVGWGTLTASGIATVYLLIYGAVAGRRLRPRNS